MKSCFLLTAACLLFACALQAQDTVPPEITSFAISPTTVDITSGAATVQVKVGITDDDTGFRQGSIFLYSAGDRYVDSVDFNSDQLDPENADTYLVDVVIPKYAAAGNWRMEARAYDMEYNMSDYGGGDLPFPVPGSEVFAVTTTGTVDILAPELVSISVSPSTVDVTSQAQTVSITVHLTDDLSGLRYAYAMLRGPNNSDPNIVEVYQRNAAPGLLDKTYTFDMTVPKGGVAGSWSVTNYVRDQVGNSIYLSPTPGTAFTVVNTTGLATGGLADACDATQFPWTTSGDADWKFQTATTYDGIDAAQSGSVGDNGQSVMEVEVSGPGTLTFWWKTDCASGDALSVETTGSGDSDTLGGHTGWAPVSLNIEAGTQTVTWTYSKDGSGSEGEDCGWVDRVQFTAEEDTEAPVVQYLMIAPNPASVSNGDVDVTLTFEVSDDYSGVSGGEVIISDPNGTGYSTSFSSDDRLPDGDDSFGTYQVTFSLPQSDFYAIPSNLEFGVWQTQITVEDYDSNSRSYGQYGDALPVPDSGEFTVTGDSVGGTLGIASIDSFMPDPVDVTLETKPLTVNFTVDNPDGAFSYGNVFLYRTDGDFVASYYFNGDDGSNDEYSVTVDIPRYGQPGQWRIGFLLVDMDDNQTDVSGSIQNQDDDEFTVTNTGDVDSEPVLVSSVSIAPKVVDTSTASASIAVTVGVSDDLSGLSSMFLYFISPSGNESNVYVNPASVVNGSFTVNRTIPQGSEEGVWRLKLNTRDNAGNYLSYGTNGSQTPFPVPADAQFTVGPVTGSSFANFAAGYSLTGNGALLGANPDNDWAPNALEFLLGLDPTVASVPDPALYHASRAGNELRLDFKPAAGLAITSSGDFLNVANAAGDAPMRMTGQTATDLAGPWTDVLPQDAGGGIYRVTLPIGPGVRGFCRLKFLDP